MRDCKRIRMRTSKSTDMGMQSTFLTIILWGQLNLESEMLHSCKAN